MSDELDFDMEIIENDRIDDLGTDDASRSEEDRSHSETGEAEEKPEQSQESKSKGTKPEPGVTSPHGEEKVFEKSGKVEGWRQKKLGSIFDQIYSGGTPKKGVDEYYGGDLPFVKIEDLNRQQGKGISTAETHITEKAVDETSTRAFQPGTLLLTIYGSLAETALVRNRVATNQAILGLWGTEENTLYVKYAIDSDQDKLQSLSRQTTQANLGKGIVSKHRLSVPPLPEQRKIASVLYTVDRAIQKTEAIIEQAKRVKRGLMQDLFQNGPNPEKSESVETRFGPVLTNAPTHWDRAKIGDLYSEYQLGTADRGSTEDRKQIPLIKMGNLSFGTWDFSEVETIDYDSELLETYRLEKGDLLFNTRNTPELVGKTAVWDSQEDAIYDNNLLRLRFDDRIDSGHYVSYYLSSSIGRRQLRARVHGTTSVAAIYQSDLEQVKIPLPPIDEQRQIVQKLRGNDRLVERNSVVHDELKRLKKGLMQDLLTGEVRTANKAIEVLDEVDAHG